MIKNTSLHNFLNKNPKFTKTLIFTTITLLSGMYFYHNSTLLNKDQINQSYISNIQSDLDKKYYKEESFFDFIKNNYKFYKTKSKLSDIDINVRQLYDTINLIGTLQEMLNNTFEEDKKENIDSKIKFLFKNRYNIINEYNKKIEENEKNINTNIKSLEGIREIDNFYFKDMKEHLESRFSSIKEGMSLYMNRLDILEQEYISKHTNYSMK